MSEAWARYTMSAGVCERVRAHMTAIGSLRAGVGFYIENRKRREKESRPRLPLEILDAMKECN